MSFHNFFGNLRKTKNGGSVQHQADTKQSGLALWRSLCSSRPDSFDASEWKGDLKIDSGDLVLYAIEEVVSDHDAPQLEALANVFACMAEVGKTLIYLIQGDKQKITICVGYVRDRTVKVPSSSEVKTAGDEFFKSAIKGNFVGSEIRQLSADEVKKLYSRLFDKENGLLYKDSNSNASTLENGCVLMGVPGVGRNKDFQDFRGIDRLIDMMFGDEFAFMVLARPISQKKLERLRRDVFMAYQQLTAAPHMKYMETGEVSVHNTQIGSHRQSDGSSYARNQGEDRNEHGDLSHEVQHSRQQTAVSSSSQTTSIELTDKFAAEWINYFDNILIPRLDYALGKGAFVATTVLLGEKPIVTQKLSRAARSIFAGEAANMVPFKEYPITRVLANYVENFVIPFKEEDDNQSIYYRQTGLLEYCDEVASKGNTNKHVVYAGNWMSVRELTLMAGFPQKEVAGCRLREEVEFGLNVPTIKSSDTKDIKLGNLVKGGVACQESLVVLGKDQLSRHVFIAGVTGSGKTTTCQTLLLSSEVPFLVIEPAKTEYRGLAFSDSGKDPLCKDLLVFTLGDDTVAPFRLNPFELIPGESVASRVDMFMASVNAAFEMEAAIPQLIERAIYSCYEDYGWNIEDNTNSKYNNNKDVNPFSEGEFVFPTLSDVLKKVEQIVDEQGFDSRLKNDYVGSIRARFQGLMLGAKGLMLDCPRSVDFVELLEKKVVFELEAIPNSSQKSLVMGLILTNLLQAVKYKYKKNGDFSHITLVEEAHRLLSKVEPGDSPSRKLAAEMFADMLAEIRKYGESMVIADQIPGKLLPEVMKNTNTKIIHRLFAQDDKESVGHTMGLEREQVDFLSKLRIGRAIISNGNWPKPVQIQVHQAYETAKKLPGDCDQCLRNSALEFYLQHPKRGVLGMSHLLKVVNGPKQKHIEAFKEHIDYVNKLAKQYRMVAIGMGPSSGISSFNRLQHETSIALETFEEILSKENLWKGCQYLLRRPSGDFFSVNKLDEACKAFRGVTPDSSVDEEKIVHIFFGGMLAAEKEKEVATALREFITEYEKWENENAKKTKLEINKDTPAKLLQELRNKC